MARLPWLAAAALVALAAVPYLASLEHPMLHDDRTLLDNRWLREGADAGSVFRHHYWHGTRHGDSDLFRPLTVLTLSWNLQADNTRLSLRATNLVLHAGAVLLVWLFSLRVLDLFRGTGGETRPRGIRMAAWAGAALFAVHPLGSEAVLFAVGRAELQAAALSLAAFLCLPLGGGTDSPLRLVRLAASPVLFFLALCSKESAASWIAILAVLWVCLRIAGRERGALLAAASAWAAALALFLFLRGQVVAWMPADPPWVDNPLTVAGPAARFANALLLHGMYVGKMIWPHTLSVDHGFDQTRVLPFLFSGMMAGTVVAGIWILVAAALKRTSGAALFLWAFLPASFAVTGNFLFPIGTIFAERLAYLPLAGFCGLAGILLSRTVRSSVTVTVILVLVLTVAAGRTAVRTADLRDHTTFVEATAEASPRAVKALVNAGRSRLKLGDAAGARDLLERAVEIWPEYRRALQLLSRAHATLGNRAEAEEYRRRSAALD